MITGPYRALILVLVGTLALPACYTTAPVPPASLEPLTRAQHARELVVPTVDGRSVRVGPNSQIRFLRVDGLATPWVPGSQLFVSGEGVYARTLSGVPELQARWTEVTGAEVKNLSGGKTVLVVLAVAVIVGVIVAMALGGGKGGGGGGARIGGGSRGGGGSGRIGGGGHHGRIGGGGHHGRIGGPTVRPGGRVVRVRPGQSGHHLDLTVPVDPQGPVDPDGVAIPPPPPPPPSAAALPLFTAGLQRQARVLWHASLWGGGDLTDRVSGGAGVHVGMRLAHVFEVGFGARLLGHRTDREVAAGFGTRTDWMGLMRVGLHFDLDAARRVAIPLGLDVGAGHAVPYVRMYVGLRVRLVSGLYLGIYPISPTYADLVDPEKRGASGWWTFPSELEIGFTF